jgi:hypothetical protein
MTAFTESVVEQALTWPEGRELVAIGHRSV